MTDNEFIRMRLDEGACRLRRAGVRDHRAFGRLLDRVRHPHGPRLADHRFLDAEPRA